MSKTRPIDTDESARTLLNVCPMATDPSARGDVHQPRPDHGLTTVLVVDDDEDSRDSVAEMLRDEGFDVRTACDGYEALERIALEPRPAAMVLDLGMPRMGGREVLSRLQGQGDLANIPVCVLSGELLDASTLPLGAMLAIPKPLLVHRLVQILEWLHECSRTRPRN
jgi:CheY-like chemotaxis protein